MKVGTAVDSEEFEELYRATVRDVLGYLRRRNSGDVEDLAAEVYAIAWRRRDDLPAPIFRRAWLFGVARTLLKAAGRERLRDRELIEELALRPGPRQASQERSESTATLVAAALERLGSKDREILRLVAWEGLTPAELAMALGVRPGTARVRLHRARRALAADPDIRALVGPLGNSLGVLPLPL